MLFFFTELVDNKAKRRISKRVFQENKAHQIFWKTSICYILNTQTVTQVPIFSELNDGAIWKTYFKSLFLVVSTTWISKFECIVCTAQKMKFSIKDFFSKCDQIRRKLRIWSHLPKKYLMENFIFCAVMYIILPSWIRFCGPALFIIQELSFLNFFYKFNFFLNKFLFKLILTFTGLSFRF